MKNTVFGVLCVIAFFASLRVFADRSDVWSAASVQVREVQLLARTDGGCAVSAGASYTKADGGSVFERTTYVDVAGANRTACLDILNNKAPALFKADRGL